MEKSIHQARYRTLIGLLREKREDKNITQVDLAKRLGVSQTVVSKIETCERRLDVIELMSICDVIDVPFVDFINELKQK